MKHILLFSGSLAKPAHTKSIIVETAVNLNKYFDNSGSFPRTYWIRYPQTMAQNSALLAQSIRNIHKYPLISTFKI